MLKRPYRGRLRAEFAIAISCAFLIALLWALVFERVRYERQQTIEDEVNNNENLALALDERTTLNLKIVDKTLRLLLHEYARGGGRIDFRKLTGAGLLDVGGENFYGVIDEHGVLAMGSSAFKRVDLSDRAHFRIHQQRRDYGMFIGKPLLRRVTGLWAIQMSRRIDKPDGSFGGVVYMSVNPAYFTRFSEHANVGRHGEIMILGLDGIALARQEGSSITFGQDLSKGKLLAEERKNRTGNYSSPGGSDGIARFVSYRTLSEYPLIVAVGTGQAEVLRDFQARRRAYYLVAASVTAGVLVFALGLIVVLARQKRAEFLARSGEQRFRSMIENASDLVALVDVRGVIRYISPSVKRLGGYEIDDIQGRNLFEFIHPQDLAAAREALSAIVRNTNARAKGERRFRHKDGGWIILETISRNALDDPTLGGIVINGRDITERKNTDRVLAENEERFRSLVEQSIAGNYIIQDNSFAYVNARFAELFGYASPAGIIGLDPLLLVAEHDRPIVKSNIQLRIEGKVKSLNYEFTGLRKDRSTFDVGAHGTATTYRGRLAIVGTLQDISEKNRAEDQIKLYVEQLENAFMRTVEVATTLSEMRDPYTAGHEKRVAAVAVAIGAELGFDARRQEGLRVAGYLHDIGKITIPAEILSKPTKLSPVEYELIKGHPQAGYDVLKGVEFPWPVAQVALQHHERLDGSGYPQGLKGDAILLEARVMAVADVVEAMSSHRPYRPGLGTGKALAEIERGRGTVYDPIVADACIRLFRDKGYAIPA